MTDTAGQPSEGTPQETTGAGTEAQVAGAQTTASGTVADQEESFFDPSQIPEELKPAYKQMQRAFTEKTTALKSHKAKIDAYDQFLADPTGTIKALAQQYGLTLAEAKQVAAEANTQSWEPKSWDDVLAKTRQEAEQGVLQRLQPIISEVQATKKQSIERMLDESCPDWRVYEDKMKETLNKHPTLVEDPVTLYELSLPKEVRQSRATQEALKKLEKKAKGASVSSGSNTNKTATVQSTGRVSFDEAVALAKAKLAEEGVRGPWSN